MMDLKTIPGPSTSNVDVDTLTRTPWANARLALDLIKKVSNDLEKSLSTRQLKKAPEVAPMFGCWSCRRGSVVLLKRMDVGQVHVEQRLLAGPTVP